MSVALTGLERLAAYLSLGRARARAVGPLFGVGDALVSALLARLRAVLDGAAGRRERLAALLSPMRRILVASLAALFLHGAQ